MKLLFQKWHSVIVPFMALIITPSLSAQVASPYYYQLRIYHLKTDAQEKRLDRFLEHSFVPAMHNIGIGLVGVFKPITQDSDKRIYVFVPYKTLGQVVQTEQQLVEDPVFIANGGDYINATYNDYPYDRIETILLSAFQNMMAPAVPRLMAKKRDRVYELRSYENPSEKAAISKIKMMNEGGEVDMFSRLGFNAIFYGKVIVGSRMPNLMYLTAFNSKADRDIHWANFAELPEWKSLLAQPEYQHNLNNANIWLLYPVDYSDF